MTQTLTEFPVGYTMECPYCFEGFDLAANIRTRIRDEGALLCCPHCGETVWVVWIDGDDEEEWEPLESAIVPWTSYDESV